MDKFEEILLKHQNNRFLVIDPMRGKGDKLICEGMEKKLKELGISLTTLQSKCEQTRLFEIRNLVAGARKVFTDRLHVGILSAALGKDTVLYPLARSLSHKNKGVYEFSLYKFPNVRFINSPRFELKRFL